MAYTTGDTIDDAHYNGFATSVNTLWGTGSGNKGLGQTTTVATVSAGTTITASQWSTLLDRIRSISDHYGQDGSITIDTVSNPSAGNTISVFSTLSADITTITNAQTGVQTPGAGWQAGVTSTMTSTANINTLTFTRSMSFSSANQMRYFFNGGGKVHIDWSMSITPTNAKETAWSDLANNNAGTYIIYNTASGRSGGVTPTVNNTNRGFWDMNTTETEVYKVFNDASGYYTANYINLTTWTNAAPGSSTTLNMRSNWVDAAGDGPTTFNKNIYNAVDNVGGTKIMQFTHYRPNNTYLATNDPWGTITFS